MSAIRSMTMSQYEEAAPGRLCVDRWPDRGATSRGVREKAVLPTRINCHN